MPGGINGVLFASVQRCRERLGAPFDVNRDDPEFHECTISDTAAQPCQISNDTFANCGDENWGMLRAFDPITLQELWKRM